MSRKTTWSLLLVLLFLMPGLGAAPGHAAPVYVLLTTIPVPSNPAGNVQGGAFTGYETIAFTSSDGKRQAVLMVNLDPTAQSPAARSQFNKLVQTAYCSTT